MRPITRFRAGRAAAVFLALTAVARGADSPANIALDKQSDEIVGKAYNYLSTKGQAADGSFSAGRAGGDGDRRPRAAQNRPQRK